MFGNGPQSELPQASTSYVHNMTPTGLMFSVPIHSSARNILYIRETNSGIVRPSSVELFTNKMKTNEIPFWASQEGFIGQVPPSPPTRTITMTFTRSWKVLA